MSLRMGGLDYLCASVKSVVNSPAILGYDFVLNALRAKNEEVRPYSSRRPGVARRSCRNLDQVNRGADK